MAGADLSRAVMRARSILRVQLTREAARHWTRRPPARGDDGEWVWIAKGDRKSPRGAIDGRPSPASSEGQRPPTNWMTVGGAVGFIGLLCVGFKAYLDISKKEAVVDAVLFMQQQELERRRQSREERRRQSREPVVVVIDKKKDEIEDVEIDRNRNPTNS